MLDLTEALINVMVCCRVFQAAGGCGVVEQASEGKPSADENCLCSPQGARSEDGLHQCERRSAQIKTLITCKKSTPDCAQS